MRSTAAIPPSHDSSQAQSMPFAYSPVKSINIERNLRTRIGWSISGGPTELSSPIAWERADGSQLLAPGHSTNVWLLALCILASAVS